MRTPHSYKCIAGFTLIEAVVALATLALCAGTLLNVIGSSMRRSEQARDHASAQMLARSLLERLRAGDIGWPSNPARGESDGFVWRLYAAEDTYLRLPETATWRPYAVTVSVSQHGESNALLSLESIELRQAR